MDLHNVSVEKGNLIMQIQNTKMNMISACLFRSICGCFIGIALAQIFAAILL